MLARKRGQKKGTEKGDSLLYFLKELGMAYCLKKGTGYFFLGCRGLIHQAHLFSKKR